MSCKLHLVEKFVTNCIKEDALKFVQIKIVLEEYQSALNLWTDEERSVRPTKVLIKQQVFQ